MRCSKERKEERERERVEERQWKMEKKRRRKKRKVSEAEGIRIGESKNDIPIEVTLSTSGSLSLILDYPSLHSLLALKFSTCYSLNPSLLPPLLCPPLHFSIPPSYLCGWKGWDKSLLPTYRPVNRRKACMGLHLLCPATGPEA